MRAPPHALLVSAPRSGSGKTVVTIGLQRAFARAGMRVAGAKTGPDYIDPGFHAAACGRPSQTLDGFAMGADALRGHAAAIDAELIVGEGAMGLFDGAGTGAGSTAAVARTLDWPVLLVLDASGAAQTLAALAHGLATMPGAPRVIGAIANRVASARHGRMIAAGFAGIGVPLLGTIPRDDRLALPSRHLGLVQAQEISSRARIDGIADVIAEHCDLDAIRRAASAVAPAPMAAATMRPPGQRIAIARDAAFGFLYPHLIEGWRRAGADLAYFSPLADDAPPEACDTCWLPGGYPELHAGQLAGNARFLDGLRRFAATRPVHGECGGYMVLGDGIEDADGVTHAMAGLLPIASSIARRKLQLGYRRATWTQPMPFAATGDTHVGHEFHYATLTRAEGMPIATLTDGDGAALGSAGTRAGHVTGSFFHLIA
ncbi:cobyrinate a,c-diamide synthase [Sphingomonas sp. PB4P5]|uniref:cobyrinate a,c-diamide synthase n=1 Tax=Parasphingomonas puruogangriensis TaxID=3096155 RepID=UPI002FCB8F6A